MRKAYFNQKVTYTGPPCEEYVPGELNSIDITPMTGNMPNGEKDLRIMLYKTVTNIFKEGKDPSGYRVYASMEDIQKDFKFVDF